MRLPQEDQLNLTGQHLWPTGLCAALAALQSLSICVLAQGLGSLSHVIQQGGPVWTSCCWDKEGRPWRLGINGSGSRRE